MIALCQSGTGASSERKIIRDGPSRCSPFERHRSNAPQSRPLCSRSRPIDWQPKVSAAAPSLRIILASLSLPRPLSLSIFPSLFSIALRIKALLKDESRGPLQTKKERELDPVSNGGEWWLEFEAEVEEGWGENIADRTHFNKTIMAIVLLVWSAERYDRKRWRQRCSVFYDLSIDSTAAEVEPQVPGSFATLLNYPTTRTFFLVKMLEMLSDRRGPG